MDDNTVFNKKQNTDTQETSRITLDDLYGSSSTPPQPPSPAAQPRAPEPQQTTSQQVQNQPSQPPLGTIQGTTPPNQPLASNVAPMGTAMEEYMRRRKKRIIMWAGAALILFLFLIGAVFTIMSNATGGIIGGEKVTLTYWGLWEEQKTMQPIIADFNKKYPNIEVVYSKQDSKLYKDRLVTRTNNNKGPDIFTFHNTWLASLAEITAPLPSSVITADEFKKQYYPVIQQDLVKNGAIYGIPQGLDTLALFTNKEIFDAAGLEVPQTWDDFIRAAKSLTVKQADGSITTAGASMGTYDNIQHVQDILSMLMLQNGVDMTKLSEGQELIGNAIIFYMSFARDKDNVWNEAMNPSLQAFANGETAMYFGYSWNVFSIKALNPDLIFEVHEVPNLPSRRATTASYWVNGISAKSPHQNEAMLFMHHLAQKEVQQKLFTEQSKIRLFGTPYARRDLASTIIDNPMLTAFIKQAEFAKSTLFSSDTKDTSFNEKINNYLATAFDSIQTGAVSMDTALKTLIAGVEQVLASPADLSSQTQ